MPARAWRASAQLARAACAAPPPACSAARQLPRCSGGPACRPGRHAAPVLPLPRALRGACRSSAGCAACHCCSYKSLLRHARGTSARRRLGEAADRSGCDVSPCMSTAAAPDRARMANEQAREPLGSMRPSVQLALGRASCRQSGAMLARLSRLTAATSISLLRDCQRSGGIA